MDGADQHHAPAALRSGKDPEGPRGNMDISDKAEISCPYRDSNSRPSSRQ